jgi:hypothetical protein
MQEGHRPGNTSALWARTPGGLAAGVSDRPEGCEDTDRRVAPGIFVRRLESGVATLARKTIKLD